jgi:hypothetical protein
LDATCSMSPAAGVHARLQNAFAPAERKRADVVHVYGDPVVPIEPGFPSPPSRWPNPQNYDRVINLKTAKALSPPWAPSQRCLSFVGTKASR